MRKLTKKLKKHLIAISMKEMRRREKFNKRRSIQIGKSSKYSWLKKPKTHTLVAPELFSIFDNVEETVQYFCKVKDTITECNLHDTLYFDLSMIKTVTADSIMYLIALIKNTKKIKTHRVNCEGNEPHNGLAKKIINEVGFFRYVSSRAFHSLVAQDKQIQIARGRKTDNSLAGNICDFVANSSSGKRDRLATKKLYTMLIELMTNTEQHAYTKRQTSMEANWYVFVENLDKSVGFLFLDTGEGIPGTVRRKWIERIVGNILTDDAELIMSALRGEFRTETEKVYRGKGLPEIYKNVQSHAFCSLKLLSGKGWCSIDHSGLVETKRIETNFDGTLYLWDIRK
jgi:hypothetical protein